MIEQINNALTFLAFFTASKQGKTGLSPTVDLYKNGSQVVTGSAASAVGGGLYGYTLGSGSVDAEGYYCAVFKTTDSTVDQQHLPSLWLVGKNGAEYLDATISSRLASGSYSAPPAAAAIADAVWDEVSGDHVTTGTTGQKLSAAGGASDPLLNAVPGSYNQGSAGYALGRIGQAQIAATTPVATTGDLVVICGDDYDSSTNRTLRWVDIGSSWPNLTSASVTFSGTLFSSASFVVTTGISVLNAGQAVQTVQVELPAATTATFVAGDQLGYAYSLTAALPGAKRVTLAQGRMRVLR